MKTRIELATAVCLVGLVTGPSESRAAKPTPTKGPSIESLTTQFVSSDWPSVQSAKDALESLQAPAIPTLISLLKRDDHVQLKDTADLIYPGASEFWGHGGIVDYDIDWLSVRAGWALEDLTFQAFGFREGAIDHDALLKAVMAGKVDVPLSEVAPPVHGADAKRERRSRAAAKAGEWWAAASARWNRFAAVVEALKSGEPARQVQALNWLRNGRTRCDGLTKESFTQRLLPEVRRLTGSEDAGVKEQAAYLTRDFEANEWWCLQLKQADAKKR